MNQPARITVVGGGSWATAIIKILSEGNNHIRWWLRSQRDAGHIKKFHHNPSYLSDVQISPRKVRVCTKIKDALSVSEHIILAVPAAFVSDALHGVKPEQLAGKSVISAIKGMIPEKNQLITDWGGTGIWCSGRPDCGYCRAVPCRRGGARKAVLSDHCFAESGILLRTLPSCSMAASFTPLRLDDIYGVEYCAVMKNSSRWLAESHTVWLWR
jgi:glycerol-3-phosphate dehydrogenase (NAD(P)+)